MMGSKAFESPLISHARMRAMFRALVEIRALRQQASRPAQPGSGLEAAFVATSIDLRPEDLVSGVDLRWLTDHIRRVGSRDSARAATAAEMKATVGEIEAGKTKPRAASGALSGLERMLCAVGSATALAAAGKGAVAMAYLAQDDLSPTEWKRLLLLCHGGELPLVIVALPVPGRETKIDIGAVAARAGASYAPVIPVDAGDAVALYRVAQESIGRARADRRVAVIECVALGTDPVKLMGTQLVSKKICTGRWVAGVAAAVEKALAAR